MRGIRFGNAMRFSLGAVRTTFNLLVSVSIAADEPSQIPDRYMTLGLEAVYGI